MNDAVSDNFALGIAGFTFSSLYEPRRLRDLHAAFWKFAADSSPEIVARFATLADASLTKPQASEVLIEVADILGGFVAQLFDIGDAVERLLDETLNFEKIFQFRQDFLRTRDRIALTACRFTGPGEFRLQHADVNAVLGCWPE